MSLDNAFASLPGAPITSRLRLLVQNQDAWVARWRALGGARERVDVSAFIVRDDLFGISFLGHLLHLRENGVAVRLLVDAYGTAMARSMFDEDFLDELAAAGIEVRIYRPILSRLVQAALRLDPLAAVASEHDKLLLVDRRRAITGGRNIGSEYFIAPSRAPRAFLDVDLVADGAAVSRALERAFEAEWSSGVVRAPGEEVDLASRRQELLGAYLAMDAWLSGNVDSIAQSSPAALHLETVRRDLPGLEGALDRPRADPSVQARVAILNSVPRPGEAHDVLSGGLSRLLEGAQRDVLIQSPYLVLPEEAVRRLAAAGRRGVAITIVTNSPVSSDNALSQAVFLEQWPALLALVPGLRLFVRGDRHNLHGKSAVFDDTVAVVGSYNLDPISMTMNGEVALAVWSDAFADAVAAPIRAMIDDGPPVAHEYRIVRRADGTPSCDGAGKARVAFGPEHHGAGGSRSLRLWRGAIGLARGLASARPMFWAARSRPCAGDSPRAS